MKKMIEFINVTKVYPNSDHAAVKDLNMVIYEGEIVVFVGPSGCGKTSTMKMINRLIEPTEGKILIDGQDISKVNPLELRQNIGYVIQNTGLFPHMTIEQNIGVVPRMKKWPKKKIRERVTELLELVGLEPEKFRNRLPAQLSGGQQQRVGIARALATDPPLMIMDEPFGALDPITREHLQNEFLKIQQRVRKSIVFVTHDIDEAVKMGDKIVVMRDGQIVQHDTPANILSAPADQFIANLTGEDRAIKYLSIVPISSILKNHEEEQPDRYHGLPTIHYGGTLKDALNRMLECNATEVAAVDADNHILGRITLNQIVDAALNTKTSK